MSRLKILYMAALILTVVSLNACLTSKDVKEIVDESNSAIIVASMSGQGGIIGTEPTDPKTDNWQQEVERIEKFIANNPDQVVTNNALRIREAVLLLNVGKPNLASAVFAEVQSDKLGNSRDREIYLARESLIWWYGFGGAISDQQREVIKAEIDKIGVVADGLESTSSTRRLLEQIRVRAAIRLAESLSNMDDIRDVLSEPLERYEQQFSKEERKLIQDWAINKDIPVAALPSLRWYNYVPCVFKQADNIVEANCRNLCPDDNCRNQCPNFTPVWIASIAVLRCF